MLTVSVTHVVITWTNYWKNSLVGISLTCDAGMAIAACPHIGKKNEGLPRDSRRALLRCWLVPNALLDLDLSRAETLSNRGWLALLASEVLRPASPCVLGLTNLFRNIDDVRSSWIETSFELASLLDERGFDFEPQPDTILKYKNSRERARSHCEDDRVLPHFYCPLCRTSGILWIRVWSHCDHS